MKLPVHIAIKLLQLQDGNPVPMGQLRHTVIDKMIADGVLQVRNLGRNKNHIYKSPNADIVTYTSNHFGIENLQDYVDKYASETLTRSEAIKLAGDSKLKAIRSFKGFLVNSFSAIETQLNGEALIINPGIGAAVFISDFENFIPAKDVMIVGIENPENFRFVHQQQHLFIGINPLFISRYPQSQFGDVLKWLKAIENPYLHFGDFDFAGINIYLNEYKKHLGERASFFIPQGFEEMLQARGNRKLYDTQLHLQPTKEALQEDNLMALVGVINQYKKGLEQEYLISVRL